MLLNPEILKCYKGVCFSLHFRLERRLHSMGKVGQCLERKPVSCSSHTCFFLQTPSCYWYAQELALLRLSKKHPDKLLSWLLPFKTIFGCDSFKKKTKPTPQEPWGKEVESFSCPSLTFSQIPKRCCTWSFDNSVYIHNWLQKLTKGP